MAHAALGAYRQCCRQHVDVATAWEESGEATIVVGCSDFAELEALMDASEARGLLTHVVADAGRTEVSPGSITVGAVGPARPDEIDEVTGRLSLL